MTNKRFKPLNGKALMYVFSWKVTISSLAFIETCISKIDFKTFYANSIVTPLDRSVNGVCRGGSHLTAAATQLKQRHVPIPQSNPEENTNCFI